MPIGVPQDMGIFEFYRETLLEDYAQICGDGESYDSLNDGDFESYLSRMAEKTGDDGFNSILGRMPPAPLMVKWVFQDYINEGGEGTRCPESSAFKRARAQRPVVLYPGDIVEPVPTGATVEVETPSIPSEASRAQSMPTSQMPAAMFTQGRTIQVGRHTLAEVLAQFQAGQPQPVSSPEPPSEPVASGDDVASRGTRILPVAEATPPAPAASQAEELVPVEERMSEPPSQTAATPIPLVRRRGSGDSRASRPSPAPATAPAASPAPSDSRSSRGPAVASVHPEQAVTPMPAAELVSEDIDVERQRMITLARRILQTLETSEDPVRLYEAWASFRTQYLKFANMILERLGTGAPNVNARNEILFLSRYAKVFSEKILAAAENTFSKQFNVSQRAPFMAELALIKKMGETLSVMESISDPAKPATGAAWRERIRDFKNLWKTFDNPAQWSQEILTGAKEYIRTYYRNFSFLRRVWARIDSVIFDRYWWLEKITITSSVDSPNMTFDRTQIFYDIIGRLFVEASQRRLRRMVLDLRWGADGLTVNSWNNQLRSFRRHSEGVGDLVLRVGGRWWLPFLIPAFKVLRYWHRLILPYEAPSVASRSTPSQVGAPPSAPGLSEEERRALETSQTGLHIPVPSRNPQGSSAEMTSYNDPNGRGREMRCYDDPYGVTQTAGPDITTSIAQYLGINPYLLREPAFAGETVFRIR